MEGRLCLGTRPSFIFLGIISRHSKEYRSQNNYKLEAVGITLAAFYCAMVRVFLLLVLPDPTKQKRGSFEPL